MSDKDIPIKKDPGEYVRKPFPVKPSFPKVYGRLRSLSGTPELGNIQESKKPSFTPNIPSSKPLFIPKAKPKAPSTQKPSNVNNERRKRSQSHPSKVNIKKDIVEAESVLQMELEDDFMTNELKYVKEYKKSEIAPTSQSMGIDPLDKTHPLTLPFLNPKANLDDKLSLKSGELFFVQLPSSLPIKLKKEEMEIIENPEEDKKDSKENGNLLSTFPSSKIGKLQIYKSGKMKLIIGDVSFHVATGMPCNFLQEVVAISEKSGKYYQIGEITKRMVCYPDIVNSESNKS